MIHEEGTLILYDHYATFNDQYIWYFKIVGFEPSIDEDQEYAINSAYEIERYDENDDLIDSRPISADSIHTAIDNDRLEVVEELNPETQQRELPGPGGRSPAWSY